MSDDGRLPPAWGSPGGSSAREAGLAGLFDAPPDLPPSASAPTAAAGDPASGSVQGPGAWTAVPAPPDPAQLAAQHQTQLEAAAAAVEVGQRSGGAHRARRQPARYALPAIGAAIALLLIGVGLSGWLGDQSTTSQGAVSTTAGSRPNLVTSTATPTPTATRVASPSAKPTASHAPLSRPVAVAPPVVHAATVVLNETVIRGLAAAVATALRTKGWVVTGIGNWHGFVPTTTVYYPPGMLAAARSMGYDLHVVRIRPSVPGMLGNRLTVVLTANPF